MKKEIISKRMGPYVWTRPQGDDDISNQTKIAEWEMQFSCRSFPNATIGHGKTKMFNQDLIEAKPAYIPAPTT